MFIIQESLLTALSYVGSYFVSDPINISFRMIQAAGEWLILLTLIYAFLIFIYRRVLFIRHLGDETKQFVLGLKSFVLDKSSVRFSFTPDTVRATFSALDVMKVRPIDNHTHGVSAATRNSARPIISHFASLIGRSAFYLQRSHAMERVGASGNLYYSDVKHATAAPSMSKPPKGCVIGLVDQDQYADMATIISVNDSPIVLSTFMPSRACANTKEYCYTFQNDGKCKYSVSGGAVYVARIWQWNEDVISVEHWVFGILTSVTACHVERKFLDDDHQLICVCPYVRWNWPFSYLARDLKAKPLRYMDPVYGEHAVLEVHRKNGLSYSIGRLGEYLAVTITAEELSAASAVERNSSTGVVIGTLLPHTEGIRNAAIMLRDYFLATKDRHCDYVYPVNDSVETYQHFPENFDPDARVMLKPFMSPIVKGLAFAGNDCFNNEKEAIIERGLKPSHTKETPVTPRIAAAMEAFVRFIIPSKLVHTGVPYAADEVAERLNKPKHKVQLERAFNQESTQEATMMLKAETYAKVKPNRLVTIFDSSDKVMYAQFVYPVADIVAEQPWYAFAKTPKQIATKVAAVCMKSKRIAKTDFRFFDATLTSLIRKLQQMVYTRYYKPEYHDQVLNLHGRHYKLIINGRHGNKYWNEFVEGSGGMDTSFFNTIANAFDKFYAYLNMVNPRTGVPYTEDEAWVMVCEQCFFGGDDGLGGDMDGDVAVKCSKELGFELTFENIERHEPGIMFLSRCYSPDVWEGELDSCADIKRVLAKFHVTHAMSASVKPLTKLLEKSYAYFLSDANTPVIGTFVSRVETLKMYEFPDFRFNNIHEIWNANFAKDVHYPNRYGEWMEEFFLVQFPDLDHGQWDKAIKTIPTLQDMLDCPLLTEVEAPPVTKQVMVNGDLKNPPGLEKQNLVKVPDAGVAVTPVNQFIFKEPKLVGPHVPLPMAPKPARPAHTRIVKLLKDNLLYEMELAVTRSGNPVFVPEGFQYVAPKNKKKQKKQTPAEAVKDAAKKAAAVPIPPAQPQPLMQFTNMFGRRTQPADMMFGPFKKSPNPRANKNRKVLDNVGVYEKDVIYGTPEPPFEPLHKTYMDWKPQAYFATPEDLAWYEKLTPEDHLRFKLSMEKEENFLKYLAADVAVEKQKHDAQVASRAAETPAARREPSDVATGATVPPLAQATMLAALLPTVNSLRTVVSTEIFIANGYADPYMNAARTLVFLVGLVMVIWFITVMLMDHRTGSAYFRATSVFVLLCISHTVVAQQFTEAVTVSLLSSVIFVVLMFAYMVVRYRCVHGRSNKQNPMSSLTQKEKREVAAIVNTAVDLKKHVRQAPAAPRSSVSPAIAGRVAALENAHRKVVAASTDPHGDEHAAAIYTGVDPKIVPSNLAHNLMVHHAIPDNPTGAVRNPKRDHDAPDIITTIISSYNIIPDSGTKSFELNVYPTLFNPLIVENGSVFSNGAYVIGTGNIGYGNRVEADKLAGLCSTINCEATHVSMKFVGAIEGISGEIACAAFAAGTSQLFTGTPRPSDLQSMVSYPGAKTAAATDELQICLPPSEFKSTQILGTSGLVLGTLPADEPYDNTDNYWSGCTYDPARMIIPFASSPFNSAEDASYITGAQTCVAGNPPLDGVSVAANYNPAAGQYPPAKLDVLPVARFVGGNMSATGNGSFLVTVKQVFTGTVLTHIGDMANGAHANIMHSATTSAPAGNGVFGKTATILNKIGAGTMNNNVTTSQKMNGLGNSLVSGAEKVAKYALDSLGGWSGIGKKLLSGAGMLAGTLL